MFERWHDFYILVGSGAGALIGLLFIVVTLTSNRDRDQALRAAARYMTPTVVEFSAVLLIGAVAAAPLGDAVQCELLVAMGLVLLAWASVNAWRMFFQPIGEIPAHWTDRWAYGAVPAAAYLALTVAAGMRSPLATGVVAVTLLMCGIRNAWDLITWIAPRGAPPTPPPE